MAEEQREHFKSRIGFIFVAAGCAIGLGNVWRFPYITGQYGGAAFIVLYLIFLVILGLPVMVMEFAVGRASQKSTARSFDVLPSNKNFRWFGWWGYIGSMLLLMFYTTICGWMLSYIPKMASGMFDGAVADTTANAFGAMVSNPSEMMAWMLVSVAVGVIVCALGIEKGVERVSKFMMSALLLIMIILCVRAVTLPGATEGLQFYLLPDFGHLFAGETPAEQMGSFGNAVYAAMGQAFFSLSVGMGGQVIFGSRIGRERSLTGEALSTVGMDTGVAIMAGLIIFPACFAFGVEPGAGPGLVFVTLPSVFEQMPLGQLWCSLFFVFMSFAALSTIIAVFEGIIAFAMDQWGWSRGKSVAINGVLLVVLSLPCALGFNIWSDFQIPGIGDIQGLEDFILSNNMLPIGALIICLFCTSAKGWGWKNFIAEADTGKGAKFPQWTRAYMKYVVPVLIVVVLIMGWVPVVNVWIGG